MPLSSAHGAKNLPLGTFGPQGIGSAGYGHDWSRTYQARRRLPRDHLCGRLETPPPYTPPLTLLLGEMVGPPLRARFNGLSESRELPTSDRKHQNPGLPKGEPNPGFRDFPIPGWKREGFARPSMLTAVMEKPRMRPKPNLMGGWAEGGSSWPHKT